MASWKEIVDAIKAPITPYQHSRPSNEGERRQFEEGGLDENPNTDLKVPPKKKAQAKKKKKKSTKGKKK